MFTDRPKEPHFSHPVRQVVTMAIVLGLVAFGSVAAYPVIGPIYFSSPWLNGIILGVFGIGVLACFWQVLTLIASVNWIEGFALDRPGHEFSDSPSLMASLAALLRDAHARKSLTATSTRSILDSVGTRLDEAREITRYIINLLIFLGLLGTFYGLATTVPAVVDTIRSLAPHDGADAMSVFDNLMTGLEQQLGGMGTAFSSSLLGLAGSLVVGMLELFAGHGQNRFFNELEEWLSSITKVGFSSEEGGGGVPAALSAMVEQSTGASTAQIKALTEFMKNADKDRAATDARLTKMTEAIIKLAEKMPQEDSATVVATAVDGLAESQAKIAALLEDRSEDGGALDAESRKRLRNIDVQLLRVLEEMAAGRQDAVAELRQEIGALSEAIRTAMRGE